MQILTGARLTAGAVFTVSGGAGGNPMAPSPLTFTSSSLGSWNLNTGPVTSSTGIFMAAGSDSNYTNGVYLTNDGGTQPWGGNPSLIRSARFVAVGTNSSQAARSTNYSASTWNLGSIPSGAWTGTAAGLGLIAAVRSGSDQAAYSLNGGATWANSTLPASAEWQGLAFGQNNNYQPVFVTVAANSDQAAYSLNGTTWQTSTLPFSGNWRGIAYAGTDYNSGPPRSSFIAVASGVDTAAVSTDGGATWNYTSANLPSVQAWSIIAGQGYEYGPAQIVIMAPNISNAAGTLDAGTSWTVNDLGSSLDWSAAVANSSQEGFVAVARNSDVTVTGTAGAPTWTNAGTLPNATVNWSALAFTRAFNGNILAVAANTTVAALSTDGGVTWSSVTMPAADAWSSVTTGGGVGSISQLYAGNVSGNPAYVAGWNPSGSITQFLYTTDYGAVWDSTTPLGTAAQPSIQGYFNNQWIGAANSPGASEWYYFTSSNLTSWSNTGYQVPGDTSQGASSLPIISTYAEGRYVAVDGSFTSNIWVSTDLSSWTNTQVTDPTVNGIRWLPVVHSPAGTGRFVAISRFANGPSGPGTPIWAYSDDATTWTTIASPANFYGDTQGVVVGYANNNFFTSAVNFATYPSTGNLYTSTDGITWIQSNANIDAGAISSQSGAAAVWNSTQVALAVTGGGGPTGGGGAVAYSI